MIKIFMFFTVSSPCSYVPAELCKLFTYNIPFSYSVHCRKQCCYRSAFPNFSGEVFGLCHAGSWTSKPCYASCVSLCWGFQVWGLWLRRARQQSFLGGLWVPTPLSGFTLPGLALHLWSHCHKLWEHKHPLTAYATFCGDVAVWIHGKQCSWQKKVG